MNYLEKLLANRRRDKRVLALRAKGQGTTEIGIRMGMSKQLVHAVIKKAKANGIKAVSPERS